MGVDYRARTAIGVPFKTADFEEHVTESVPIKICHPESVGQKFCPQCGSKTQKKPGSVTRVVPKKHVVHLEPWLSEIDAEGQESLEQHIGEYGSDGVRINTLDIINVNGDGYGGDAELVLGFDVERTASNRGGYGSESYNPSTSWGDLDKKVKDLKRRLIELGINEEPRLYTILSGS